MAERTEARMCVEIADFRDDEVVLFASTMALPVPWCLPRRRYYLRAPWGRGNPPHLRGERGGAAPTPRRVHHRSGFITVPRNDTA